MYPTKLLTLGGLLICFIVIFQLLPVLFGEGLIFITILSALPLYVLSRLNPKIGSASLIASFILISLISIHEGLFFLCTNGPVGLSLGIMHHRTKNKYLIVPISGGILTAMLSIMTFIIGIPVLGFTLPGIMPLQILLLFLFSLLYCAFYLFFSDSIFTLIYHYIRLE